MVTLIPVKYMKTEYPKNIKPRVVEVPAHFDSQEKPPRNIEYSLHTEYSYSRRKFASPACKELEWIKKANKNGVPMLWFNESWVTDFISFIFNFVGENNPPKIIEIHPPFSDYCRTLPKFITLYQKFEEQILTKYPKTQIVIENRYGSQYSKGKFILSTTHDLKALKELIARNNLKLRMVLDIPQLFSAHGLEPGKMSKEKISKIFEELYPVREFIASIHLWGKCISKNNRHASHAGDLNSYFGRTKCGEKHASVDPRAMEIKEHFLNELYNLLEDGMPRYFVPEVNSKAHLHAIVKDLTEFGFKFI